MKDTVDRLMEKGKSEEPPSPTHEGTVDDHVNTPSLGEQAQHHAEGADAEMNLIHDHMKATDEEIADLHSRVLDRSQISAMVRIEVERACAFYIAQSKEQQTTHMATVESFSKRMSELEEKIAALTTTRGWVSPSGPEDDSKEVNFSYQAPPVVVFDEGTIDQLMATGGVSGRPSQMLASRSGHRTIAPPPDDDEQPPSPPPETDRERRMREIRENLAKKKRTSAGKH